MRAFLNRVFGTGNVSGGLPERVAGRPPSPNGASSLHLLWEEVPSGVRAVRATLRVLQPPVSDDLYFFALQASFVGRGASTGGAHIGLQWNRRHPANTAVNWGGYASQARGGAVLNGTISDLPSRPNDLNTRDYSWRPGSPYRLTIGPGTEPGWWRGTIEDLDSGSVTAIRQLDGGGDKLNSVVVWSEVFASCDAPRVSVGWSHLEFTTDRDDWRHVDTVTANYQSHSDGGCSNTTASVDGSSWVQSTNAERTTPPRTRLRIADR